MGSKRPLWNDAAVTGENVLPPSAAGLPYKTTADALAGTSDALCLDGQWRFFYAPSDADAPRGFYSPGFDSSAFDNITAPHMWQTDGYGVPIYSNLTYPAALRTGLRRLPSVDPALNPAGCYLRLFDYVPHGRAVLRLNGAASCAYVWLNGEYVGFTKSSFSRAEFDVTPFIKSGSNLLALKLLRYCDGSYLENQDMWRMSGLFRSVCVYSEPEARICDAVLSAGCSETGGTLSALIKTSLEGEVSLELYDQNSVFARAKATAADREARFELSGLDVSFWTPETPKIYRAVLRFGTDTRAADVGFRTVDISGGVLRLNGQPLKLRGVNRHEFDPEHGFAVSREFNERDVKLIKQYNFNALRTSHYPPSEELLELCDRLGLLVMCENNLETHRYARRLPRGKKPWRLQALDRLRRMIGDYRNHPCIFMWSLGNESYKGRAFLDMYALAKSMDARPVHYECDPRASDVVSAMYETPQKLREFAQGRAVRMGSNTYNPLGTLMAGKKARGKPFIHCEYSHCMGNSLGNFADYWEVYRSFERMAGGFIWDWADLSLRRTDTWCYGGDFGDVPNDSNFCFDGLMRPDRKPNPALFEAQSVGAPFCCQYRGGALILRAAEAFCPLSGLRLVWSFYTDGKKSAGGEFIPEIPALSQQSYPLPEPPSGARVDLSVRLETLAADACRPAGFTVFRWGLTLRDLSERPALEDNAISIGDGFAELNAAGTKARINLLDGTAVLSGGGELFTLRPNFFRPAIDNERALLVPARLRRFFLSKHNNFSTAGYKVLSCHAGDDTLTLRLSVPGMSLASLCFSAVSGGGILVKLAVRPLYPLRRCGFTLCAPENYDQVAWYGRGPQETYPDRRLGAGFGVFRLPLNEFWHRYLYPQESANRTDVLWAELRSENAVLRAERAGRPLNFSAKPLSDAQLESAAHDSELKSEGFVTFNVDGAVRGVGGDKPGWSCVAERFQLAPRRIHTASAVFKINKVTKGTEQYDR